MNPDPDPANLVNPDSDPANLVNPDSDPDPDPGAPLNPDPIRIRIRNTGRNNSFSLSQDENKKAYMLPVFVMFSKIRHRVF